MQGIQKMSSWRPSVYKSWSISSSEGKNLTSVDRARPRPAALQAWVLENTSLILVKIVTLKFIDEIVSWIPKYSRNIQGFLQINRLLFAETQVWSVDRYDQD